MDHNPQKAIKMIFHSWVLSRDRFASVSHEVQTLSEYPKHFRKCFSYTAVYLCNIVSLAA